MGAGNGFWQLTKQQKCALTGLPTDYRRSMDDREADAPAPVDRVTWARSRRTLMPRMSFFLCAAGPGDGKEESALIECLKLVRNTVIQNYHFPG